MMHNMASKSSESSYSGNNKRGDNYFGQGGWQCSPSSYKRGSQQPPHEGMTTHPSVGRFTESEKLAAFMFVKKPATPTPKHSSSPPSSGAIVDLRASQGRNSFKGQR